MSRAIKEDVLRGVARALHIHAPHLLPTIKKLVRSGQLDGLGRKSGSSVYGKLIATLPWDEGEPVLMALQAMERELGNDALFEGRQINWLTQRWKQYSEPRRLPSPIACLERKPGAFSK
jgi:hypothetical protein